GLRGGDRQRDRLQIPHLADQDHVRVLPKDVFQRVGEGQGVAAQLPLVDQRLLVLVQEFDRIFDRYNVMREVTVDVVDHRRLRGRLAAAGRSGYQHQPAGALGVVTADRREV